MALHNEVNKLKTPKAVLAFMREVEEDETYVRKYILRQLEVYREIFIGSGAGGANLALWLALKLGAKTAAQGQAAIDWAKGGAHV